MLNFFSPRPGRFGIQPVMIVRRVNTGTLAAGTQTHNLGALPRKAIISGVTVSANTYPTAATSCAITVQKRDASAGGDVNLTSAIDVNAKTAQTAQPASLLTTLTDAQKLLDTGDQVKISLVTVGAVSVQPVDLVVVVELQYLN
jgi:hypothetical protein